MKCIFVEMPTNVARGVLSAFRRSFTSMEAFKTRTCMAHTHLTESSTTSLSRNNSLQKLSRSLNVCEKSIEELSLFSIRPGGTLQKLCKNTCTNTQVTCAW